MRSQNFSFRVILCKFVRFMAKPCQEAVFGAQKAENGAKNSEAAHATKHREEKELKFLCHQKI
jgi:hypothetical protein